MSLRARIDRLEARTGVDNQLRPDLLSYDERRLLIVFLYQAILADPLVSPVDRANAEAALAARAASGEPLPKIDEQQIAGLLERMGAPPVDELLGSIKIKPRG
jgi:hypothetical protein